MQVGSVADLQHGVMPRINKLLNKLLGYKKYKLDASFPKKSAFNTDIVAYQIAQAIEKRKPISNIIQQYMKLAESNTNVLGFRIDIKGRFKPSNRKQKTRFLYGQLPLGNISANINYTIVSAIGRYGASSVRV
jgi:ribosomal protein S3